GGRAGCSKGRIHGVPATGNTTRPRPHRVAHPFMNAAAPPIATRRIAPPRTAPPTTARSEHGERRLIECRALLAQREHVLLPVSRLAEPRKRPRKRRILPPPRDPRAAVNDPQRPQRHHEMHPPVNGIAERRVPIAPVREP